MDLKKLLRYGLYVGTFGVLLIPFIVSSSMFFPFITGKNFTFRILVELMLGGWVLLALLDARYRPQFSWILASIATFVGVMFFANLFAENPFKAFWSNFERMDGWVTLVHLLAYFLVITSVLRTEKLWERFLQTSVGVSACIGLFGLMQLAGFFTINQGGVRLDATFGNATYLAVYMLFNFFITAWLILRWRGGNYVRWLYGAIMILQAFILFFTGTRGTILGLVGGILLTGLLVALFGSQRKFVRRSAIGLILAVVVLVGSFIAIKDTSFVQDNYILKRFADISLEEGQARFLVWNAAWQGFQERPVLGWGQEGFNYVFNKYYDPQMYAQEPWFDRVHNVVFDWLVAGGILGALAYFSIPIATLYYLWFYRREEELFTIGEKSILTGLLVAYFFHNLFVFDNLVSYIYFFSVLALVHVRVTSRRREERLQVQPIPQRSGQGVVTIAGPIILVATVVTIYFVNVPGIATAQTLIKALGPQESLEKNIELFKKAIAYNSVGNQEAKEQFLQAAGQSAKLNIPMETRLLFVNESYEAILKELEENPNDARLQILTAVMLSQNGLHNDALPFIQRALELSPQKQQIWFQLGEHYFNTNQPEKGLETFKQAFELAPEFDDARILYALSAVYDNDRSLVEEILVPHFGTIAVSDDRLLNAYVENGWHEAVLEIWQDRVEDDPENARKHVSLAAAYYEAGYNTQAIAELQEAIRLNPEFTEQANSIIEDIRAGRR